MTSTHLMQPFFKLFAKHWHLFLGFVLVSLFASLLEGAGISLVYPLLAGSEMMDRGDIPFPFKQITALFDGYNFSEKFQIVAVWLVGMMVLKSLFSWLSVACSGRLQALSIKSFRDLCFEQLTQVSMSYYHSKKVGDFHTTCANYAQTLGGLVGILGRATVNFLNIFIYVVLLLFLSWQMTVVAILFAGFSSFCLRWIFEKEEISGKAYTSALTNINSCLLEYIVAMKTVRIFSREEKARTIYRDGLDNLGQSLYRLHLIRGFVPPAFETIAIICLGSIMGIAPLLFSDFEEIGLPTIGTFLVIFQRVSSAGMNINQMRAGIIGDLAAYREVIEFLRRDNKPYLVTGEKLFSELTEKIEFKNVVFAYKTELPQVFANISFEIVKGSRVGIVGSSGSGKSTIVELLLRFYDPQEGHIYIDRVDLKDFDLKVWRRKIGVVSQDVFLFHDTIRSNIAFADDSTSQESIEFAARHAYAHEFIMALPKGYDTIVGDRGVLLSGGQKQRIMIARAILLNPDILIFDEATSALDTESEVIIQQALEAVGKGKTVITVAHRLSTIFDSDKILVLDFGKIVQEGAHQELMQVDGVYRRLVRAQEAGNHDLSKHPL